LPLKILRNLFGCYWPVIGLIWQQYIKNRLVFVRIGLKSDKKRGWLAVYLGHGIVSRNGAGLNSSQIKAVSASSTALVGPQAVTQLLGLFWLVVWIGLGLVPIPRPAASPQIRFPGLSHWLVTEPDFSPISSKSTQDQSERIKNMAYSFSGPNLGQDDFLPYQANGGGGGISTETVLSFINNIKTVVDYGKDVADQAKQVKDAYQGLASLEGVSNRYLRFKPVLTKGTVKKKTKLCRNPHWRCNKFFNVHVGEPVSVLASSPMWAFIEMKNSQTGNRQVGYVKFLDLNVSKTPIADAGSNTAGQAASWAKMQQQFEQDRQAWINNELNQRCYELFPGFTSETGNCFKLAESGLEYKPELNEPEPPSGIFSRETNYPDTIAEASFGPPDQIPPVLLYIGGAAVLYSLFGSLRK
jgi:hypothetical protein